MCLRPELFTPALAHFILATTAPADVTVQAFIRQLSAKREMQGKFPVSVLSWDTVVSLLHQHPSVGPAVLSQYFSRCL